MQRCLRFRILYGSFFISKKKYIVKNFLSSMLLKDKWVGKFKFSQLFLKALNNLQTFLKSETPLCSVLVAWLFMLVQQIEKLACSTIGHIWSRYLLQCPYKISTIVLFFCKDAAKSGPKMEILLQVPGINQVKLSRRKCRKGNIFWSTPSEILGIAIK